MYMCKEGCIVGCIQPLDWFVLCHIHLSCEPYLHEKAKVALSTGIRRTMMQCADWTSPGSSDWLRLHQIDFSDAVTARVVPQCPALET